MHPTLTLTELQPVYGTTGRWLMRWYIQCINHPRSKFSSTRKATSMLGDIPGYVKSQGIVRQIQLMVEDWPDYTTEWISSRTPHIQTVYNNAPSTEIPVFLHLQETGYPNMEDAVQDFTNGFHLAGPQHPGPGWKMRKDDRYSHPITEEPSKP